MQFPLDLVDGVVCRADGTTEKVDGKIRFKKAPMQVTGGCFNGYRDAMVEKLGDKLVMNDGNVWKPNMQVMQDIMERHGATADQTVMVGDNIKSDGGIVRLGVHFAWQKGGTSICDEAQAMYSKINEMSDYKISAEGHLGLLEDMSKKDPVLGKQYQDKMVTLEGGFKDLNKYFRFQSPERAKAQAKTADKTCDAAVKAAVVARRANGR